MGGSGGGSSGTISYPAYIAEFHSGILDHNGTDEPIASFMDAYNVAYGNSPFASAVSYNPDMEISQAHLGVTQLSTFIAGRDNIVDFNVAETAARGLFLLGTSTLDSTPSVLPNVPFIPIVNPSTLDTSALDVTTLDTVVITPSEIASDIAAMDLILTDQLEQSELPQFRAGMLNINAIHSSAYIIGEALLRASKDKALAKYATELQLKISEQIREINARHALSYREITARLQTSQKEINSRHSVSYKELNMRDSITTKELIAKGEEVYREELTRLQIAQMELNARHQISRREIDAKFYIHREELIRMATVEMLSNLMKKGDLTNQHAHLNADVNRFAIVGKKEEREEQLAIDESDAKWDLDLYRVAGNLLAGPSGGVAQGSDKKSRVTSAVGGAISGAAAGAVTGAAIGSGGGPWGAAIGAVAGVGLALL